MTGKRAVNYTAIASLFLVVAFFISCGFFPVLSAHDLWRIMAALWLLALGTSFAGLILGDRDKPSRYPSAAECG